MSSLVSTLTWLAALGTATAAGAFFTFSTFTMGGLRRLAPAQGAAAMQAINRDAVRPPLMILLFGTGAACLALVVYGAQHLQEPGAKLQVLAGLLYLLGAVALTGAYHVPRNNALERMDPESAEGMAYWAIYLVDWVHMNHVRTLASLAAAALLAHSLRAK